MSRATTEEYKAAPLAGKGLPNGEFAAADIEKIILLLLSEKEVFGGSAVARRKIYGFIEKRRKNKYKSPKKSADFVNFLLRFRYAIDFKA